MQGQVQSITYVDPNNGQHCQATVGSPLLVDYKQMQPVLSIDEDAEYYTIKLDADAGATIILRKTDPGISEVRRTAPPTPKPPIQPPPVPQV